MTGYELRTFGIESNCSSNWATPLPIRDILFTILRSTLLWREGILKWEHVLS